LYQNERIKEIKTKLIKTNQNNNLLNNELLDERIKILKEKFPNAKFFKGGFYKKGNDFIETLFLEEAYDFSKNTYDILIELKSFEEEIKLFQKIHKDSLKDFDFVIVKFHLFHKSVNITDPYPKYFKIYNVFFNKRKGNIRLRIIDKIQH
jgi:hypothetical protein